MDLRERVLVKYLEAAAVSGKTAGGPPPLGNDEPPGGDPGTNPVMAASGLPGGDGGGPGKRNIPKDHPYDPRALKPLSRMLWAMSVALGHGLTAYRQFAKLKSSTISPDGMLGGRGYVMQVKEIRDKLHDACENLSSISDTIHDEINAPHWEPKMDQLDPEEALDVRKFIQESQQILQNPEEDAEDEMEAIEDATPEELAQDDTAVGDEGEQPIEDAEATDAEVDEEGVETPSVDPAQEEAFLNDQEETEAPSDEEEAIAPEDEEDAEAHLDEEESPEEEVPSDTEEEDVPAVGDEDPSEEEESYSRNDDSSDEEEEDVPMDGGDEATPDDSSDDVGDSEDPAAEEEDPAAEEESYSRQDEEEPSEEDAEQPSEEETPSEEDPSSEEDEENLEDNEITPEDEALADKAWESSGLPGAEEPRPEPLQPPKKKKKRKKFSPADMPPAATVQDQKFAPDQSQRLAYDRTANSSLLVDSLPGGPRVDHIDRAEGDGPFGSYNEDEPRIDGWSLNDGRPESDDGKYVDRLAEDIESWWDGLPQEDRTVTATSLQLRTANRVQWTSEDWEKIFAHQAGSALPEDLDTPTDGWDLGMGYGAKGDGAGGYENPSGEGNGYQGVFGPTSGLPKDGTGLMPTDVMPPVARSDYYTDGLTDDDVPEGLPSDEVFAQAELPGEPEPTQPPSNYYFGQSELPDPDNDMYTYDRDVMNTHDTTENLTTPYAEKPRSPARSDSTPS